MPMFCGNCGGKLEDGQQFCSGCGQKEKARNRRKNLKRVLIFS